ncbi:hypothetical protein Mapa_014503 [Marchantia paleacea]|nr:hypothetical protein Mapa_014503 [Marchantia paleacea]
MWQICTTRRSLLLMRFGSCFWFQIPKLSIGYTPRWEKGLTSVRLNRRLSVNLSSLINHCCEPVEVNIDCGSYTLPPKRSTLLVPDSRSLPGILVEHAYLNDDGKLVAEPMDFSEKNRMSRVDLQNVFLLLVRPDLQALPP